MHVSAGDAMWVVISAVLALVTISGTFMFYARQTRGVAWYGLASVPVVTTVWLVLGYSIAFGPNIGKAIGHGGWIGGLDFIGFRSVAGAAGAPAFFEIIVATFAVAIVIATLVDRLRRSACVFFVVCWLLLVYAPIAHWMWGGGLLGARGLGALDLAGGTVVHCTAGFAVLAAVFAVGRERTTEARPRSVPMTWLGVTLLWFGWFGFAAGHVPGGAGVTSMVIIDVQVAAAAGALAWAIVDRVQQGVPSALGGAKGALAGLVAISAAAGYVRPMAAFGIGAVAGLVCPLASEVKRWFGNDDALDVVAIHWVGGVIGTLLTGIFAAKVGLAETQRFTQLGKQAVAVVIVSAWSFALTFALLKVLEWTVGLADERGGAEVAHHGEVA